MSRWPAAILWDLDGTLVDTEPYWFAAEDALVSAHGGSWSPEQALSLVGMDLLDSGAALREQGPLPLEPAVIAQTLLADVLQRVRAHVPWRPGALELLEHQRQAGVPAALVTMSWRVLADTLVEALADGTFSAVVTGDEVSHGKPHPEPYLLAAERLGLAPADCLAIEDSVPGTSSARAAGVPVLAVPNMVPLPAAPGQVLHRTLVGLNLDGLRTLFDR